MLFKCFQASKMGKQSWTLLLFNICFTVFDTSNNSHHHVPQGTLG